MRIRTLELPLLHADADFTFALVVDRVQDLAEDDIDALRVFAEAIGAAGVLTVERDVDLPPSPAMAAAISGRHGSAVGRIRQAITAFLRERVAGPSSSSGVGAPVAGRAGLSAGD